MSLKLEAHSQNVKHRELKQEIWLSPMTKALTPTENFQHNNATNNFNYTTIANRLGTVSWSNNIRPTGVVNRFTGYQPFRLLQKDIHLKLCK